jgi:chromosome segregation ATPase
LGVATVVGGGVLFGTSLPSYVSTAFHRVTRGVENAVPDDFQIERAQQMVGELTPVIRDAMHVIAKEEVALEQLDQQIAGAEAKSDKQKSEIMRLQSDLTSGKNVFRYASHSYSRDEVEEDLERRFTRFKVEDETLAHLKEMRRARAANLDAAREKFTALVSAQKKLNTDIANLQAKKSLVEVAQASSDIVIDDSKLARTKQLITDIRTRLDVKARLANADVNVTTEIPLDESGSEDITEQVAAYFGGSAHPVPAEVSTASYHAE